MSWEVERNGKYVPAALVRADMSVQEDTVEAFSGAGKMQTGNGDKRYIVSFRSDRPYFCPRLSKG